MYRTFESTSRLRRRLISSHYFSPTRPAYLRQSDSHRAAAERTSMHIIPLNPLPNNVRASRASRRENVSFSSAGAKPTAQQDVVATLEHRACHARTYSRRRGAFSPIDARGLPDLALALPPRIMMTFDLSSSAASSAHAHGESDLNQYVLLTLTSEAKKQHRLASPNYTKVKSSLPNDDYGVSASLSPRSGCVVARVIVDSHRAGELAVCCVFLYCSYRKTGKTVCI